MSKITAALEEAVAIVLANTPPEGEPATRRQRVHADRAFAAILKLIAPRIRHFTRQYGLIAHWEDAEQCCAIGVHRAIQGYDPTRAQFTTFVNWQLRGELQALRYRLMTDQRPGAKKVAASTVSLHAGIRGAEGDDMTLESMIVDEEALDRTESAASDYLAAMTRHRLIEDYVDHLRTAGIEQLTRRARERALPDRKTAASAVTEAPRLRAMLYSVDPSERAALEDKIALHRAAIERRLGDAADVVAPIADETIRERDRQVAKRATAAITELTQRSPRFAAARATAKSRTCTPA